MRHYLTSFLFIFSIFALQSHAQQVISYSQYTLNRYALNPAVAGLRPCNETTFGNRQQWVGFEGAPNTYFASFNTRLNKDDKYPKNFHGIGAYITAERAGISTFSTIRIGYAYHIQIWKNYRLSMGIFGGIHQYNQSYDAITMQNKSIDPAIDPDKQRSLIYPDISPGGFIHNRNFYMGLSLFQGYPARIRRLGTKENRLSPHFFYTAGYRIRGVQLDFIPSMLINFATFISPTIDFTFTADYQRKIQLGIGSKYLNSAYGILHLRVLNNFTLGYSYEYALNEINQVAPQTHEFILQFTTCRLGKKRDDLPCPAYR